MGETIFGAFMRGVRRGLQKQRQAARATTSRLELARAEPDKWGRELPTLLQVADNPEPDPELVRGPHREVRQKTPREIADEIVDQIYRGLRPFDPDAAASKTCPLEAARELGRQAYHERVAGRQGDNPFGPDQREKHKAWALGLAEASVARRDQPGRGDRDPQLRWVAADELMTLAPDACELEHEGPDARDLPVAY